MGTGSFPGVESGRDVTLTPHPLPVLRSKNSRAIPILSLRAFLAYKKVKPTYKCDRGPHDTTWRVVGWRPMI